MRKCDPLVIRQNLEVSNILAHEGIDYVPIPVAGIWSKEALKKFLHDQLDKLAEEEHEG